MRTKILLTAAVLAVGALTTMAQVYSQNIVGYANVTVYPGWNGVANPFNTGGNTGAEVLPATTGTTVLQWTGVSFNTFQYDDAFGGWIDSDFNPSMPTVAPGGGFLYYWPFTANGTVTFVGNVAANSGATVHNSIGSGWQFVGSLLPFSGAVDAAPVSMPTFTGIALNIWPPLGVGWSTVNFDDSFGGWIDSDFNSVPTPSVAVGQGFMYFNPLTSAADWVQTAP